MWCKITLTKSSQSSFNVNFVLTFSKCFVFSKLQELCLAQLEGEPKNER